jgi:phosphate acyltransferase
MSHNRIALDVMGGDDAPGINLRGALRACSQEQSAPLDPARLLLVGDEGRITSELQALGGNPGFEILHAPQVIEMGDSPATALRAKPDASIPRCMGALKRGAAGAVVGMGNTGAMVGAATIGLGTLEGIRRPGIAVTIDLTGNPVTLIDMGANIAPKPEHLLQYGWMGSVWARRMLNQAEPRVGLLNIGEEPSKGPDLLKQAHELLSRSPIRFVGNVEGGDLFNNVCDVVVCDGFTGNVVLKLMEGLAGFLFGQFASELRTHQAPWGKEVLHKLRKGIDYAEYGGALLLGVDGTVVIGHGRSDDEAVANAIAVAARSLDADVNRHIVEGLAAVGQTAPGA